MKDMLCFEELESVEELGDGWMVAGFTVGVVVGCVILYVGIAT